jgi:hypothetical protein
MTDLYNLIAIETASKLNFIYNKQEAENATSYLKWIQELAKEKCFALLVPESSLKPFTHSVNDLSLPDSLLSRFKSLLSLCPLKGYPLS